MVLADLGRKITSALRALSNATVINEEASYTSERAPNLRSRIPNDTDNNNFTQICSHFMKAAQLVVAQSLLVDFTGSAWCNGCVLPCYAPAYGSRHLCVCYDDIFWWLQSCFLFLSFIFDSDLVKRVKILWVKLRRLEKTLLIWVEIIKYSYILPFPFQESFTNWVHCITDLFILYFRISGSQCYA